MAHFFLEGKGTAKVDFIHMKAGEAVRVGVWGAKIEGQYLTVSTNNPSVAKVQVSPFGGGSLHTTDNQGMLRNISVYALKEGNVMLEARLGPGGPVWAYTQLVSKWGQAPATKFYTILASDTRLGGWVHKLNDDQAEIRVDHNRLLGHFIGNVISICRSWRNQPARGNAKVKLNIYCHGGAVTLKQGLFDQPGIYPLSSTLSNGGAGLVMCKEGISLKNVNQLRDLKGVIDGGIDIYACGAAYINPGILANGQVMDVNGRIVEGDGNSLCTRIADVTGNVVRASTSVQWYSGAVGSVANNANLDFGDWEGTVLTYTPGKGVTEYVTYELER